ncbi:phosphoribosylglycinamide formyltransferase [Olsenella sp. Marseille-QA0557]|uniref:phosphoribosylglycinamide formyltransferase n=1 Tax=Olsenella sp. Marseille-QA0557 TaxID=3378782 RepID=UPI003D0E0265
MNTPLPIGILLSGNGSNLQAIIDAIEAGSVNAEIKIVISSRPSAYGLVRAERAGIPTFSMTPKQYAEDKIEADKVIAQQLLDHGVKYVIMSGYMRMVHSPILNAFPNSVVNLHPALLPSFPGAHAIDEAYDSGVKITGVTVHFANEVYDDGSIIAQCPVEVQESWTRDDLEAAIHRVEHKLYPETIQMIAEGRVKVLPDGKTQVDGKPPMRVSVDKNDSPFIRHGVRVVKGYAW